MVQLNRTVHFQEWILRLGAVGAACAFYLLSWLGTSAAEPPSEECLFTFNGINGGKLTGRDQPHGRQSSEEISAAWLERRQLPWSHWYWDFGLCSDTYTFLGVADFPLRRLQDITAEFSLEYYIQSEAVTNVTVRPGFYFENHPSLRAWDIPIEAVSGIPLTQSLSGVIGVLDARFYRHLIPVAGLVWIPSEQVRVEAVFPEPALVITLNRKLEMRVAGELGGAGFRLDAGQAHQSVEYSTYRVGATVGYQLCPRWKIALGTGYEVERTFDFLDDGSRDHAKGAPYLKLTLLFTR